MDSKHSVRIDVIERIQVCLQKMLTENAVMAERTTDRKTKDKHTVLAAQVSQLLESLGKFCRTQTPSQERATDPILSEPEITAILATYKHPIIKEEVDARLRQLLGQDINSISNTREWSSSVYYLLVQKAGLLLDFNVITVDNSVTRM